MFTELSKILKWFTNLNSEKQNIAFLGAAVIFLTFFFVKRDNQNQKQHNELKLEYKKRLDTCENSTVELQKEVIYWKDSLASEKLVNALSEINRFKDMAKQVKQVEQKINNTNKNIKNKQKQVLNKLANEK